MALYQPSNITPSTFAGLRESTVAKADNVSIAWQVNGRSALEAYQIDVYDADSTSALVHSTGITSSGCPFFGTDSKGNVQFFAYEPSGTTWASWGIDDGKQYKLRITQFYGTQSAVKFTTSAYKAANKLVYFYTNGTYYTFTTPRNIQSGTKLVYAGANTLLIGGYTEGQQLETASCTVTSTKIAESETLSGTSGTENIPYVVIQTSDSVFNARTAPTLEISAFPTPIDVIRYTFSASFIQTQNDGINWVKWTVKNAASGEVLDDTGEISTGVLEYTYDGMISGNSYTVTCEIETESGVIVAAEETFEVEYAQETTEDTITAECEDDCVKLSWGTLREIPGTPNPTSGYSIRDGVLHLAEGAKVEWDKVNGEPMQFYATSLAWKGKVEKTNSYVAPLPSNAVGATIDNSVNAVAYSPTGSQIAIAGAFTSGGVKIYDVSETEVAFRRNWGSDYPENPKYAIEYSPDGRFLVIGGNHARYANAQRIENGDIATQLVSLRRNSQGDFLDAACRAVAFSADSKYLVIGGDFTEKAILYKRSNDGTAYNFLTSFEDGDGNPLNGSVRTVAISPDTSSGSYYIAIGGDFADRAALYALADDGLVYKKPFYSNAGTTPLSWSSTSDVTFSHDGNYAILSSLAGSKFYEFSSVANPFVFAADITIPNSDYPYRARFSPDDTEFTLFCNQNCYTMTWSGTTFTERANFSYAAENGTTARPSSAFCGAYAPDMSSITLGGSLAGKATIYKRRPTQVELLRTAEIDLDGEASNITYTLNYDSIDVTRYIYNNVDEIRTFTLPLSGSAQVVSNGTNVIVRLFNPNGAFISETAKSSVALDFVNHVRMSGAQASDYVYMSSNANYNYTQNNYIPTYDNDTLFYANFEGDNGLDAGSRANTAVTAIYRISNGRAQPFGRISAGNTQLRDYGTRSRELYSYSAYTVNNETYSQRIATDRVVGKTFSAYILIEATQDEGYPDMYHVINVWRFGTNFDGGAVGNNNTPNFLENFTRYPLRQHSAQAAKSGTLSALISNIQQPIFCGDWNALKRYERLARVKHNGVIYTAIRANAGIEPSINVDSGYYWKSANILHYDDTAEQMQKLYDISTSLNDFFLKDPKGNLYKVHTASPITQTTNTASETQETSISIPWQEVGDASNAVIISLQTDAAWRG